MAVPFPQTLKRQSETALTRSRFDFIAKYHAVADLRRLARRHTEVLDEQTLAALGHLLRSQDFQQVRQSYFLFREAAAVMTDLATTAGGNGLGSQALEALQHLLRTTRGSAHRGVAEALGGLPVKIAPPRIFAGEGACLPAITWNRLSESKGLKPVGSLRYIGRSLVAQTSSTADLLVVKLAKPGDTAAGLSSEIQWMERLRTPAYKVDRRFHIPTPLRVDGRPAFRCARLPLAPPAGVNRHPEKLAIAFLAHRDYFVYPNDPGIDAETATEMLGRNAYLLGRLAAGGILHDAPIPLFHNRTQRLRRDDQGRYQWFRSGRLDQWLDSCAFPNFGLSGLRDFEHLAPCGGGGRCLYRHIGTHFLSLLLVAGSWFRCKDGAKKGWDENGQPVDARHLFDRQLLATMIREIFQNYFSGFTEREATVPLPLDAGRLVDRMITEMGVDRYMTELLRRADQKAVTDGQFLEFLESKGYSAEQLATVVRGEKDILIASGPHLGDFNRQISLPELIEGVAAMSAVCIAGRYAHQNQHRFPAMPST